MLNTRGRRGAMLVLPVLTVALGLAGCGGSSSGGSVAAGASGGASSSAAAPSTPAPSASAAETASADAGSGGDFCGIVKTNLDELFGSDMSKLLADGSKKAWKAFLDKSERANQQVIAVAPGDIKPDLLTLKKTSDELRTALESADYDVQKLGTSKLMQSISSPERVQASEKVVAYVKDKCGIDLSKAGQ